MTALDQGFDLGRFRRLEAGSTGIGCEPDVAAIQGGDLQIRQVEAEIAVRVLGVEQEATLVGDVVGQVPEVESVEV